MKARGKREAQRNASPLVQVIILKRALKVRDINPQYSALSELQWSSASLSRGDAPYVVRRLPLAFIFRAFGAWFALSILVCTHVSGQVRGVYPLGMSATNSGVTPAPGFTYANQLLIYSRNEFRGPHGEVLATGNQSVIMDLNSIIWVSRKQVLGGARFSMSATLPFANNSLSSDVSGPISGGGGFADSYYQPFILGWDKQHLAIRAVYGFLAPTGSFKVGANNNVGSGYWTHAFSSGQTIQLTKNGKTSVSAFQMYEVHTKQKNTSISPGQNLDLDYSVTHEFGLGRESQLQLGLVGYNQWQTTDKIGPGITPAQSAAHYKVNALGVASHFTLPKLRLNGGFKYFKEFSNRSTFQGYSVQFSGSIHF